MDDNKVSTVYDAINLIDEGIDSTRNIVYRNRDNTTEWVDVDNDPEAKEGVEIAKLTIMLGMLVLYKWDVMKHHFSKEVRAQIETDIIKYSEQDTTNIEN